jgi:hypothetical protein
MHKPQSARVIVPTAPIKLEGFHGDQDAKYLWCLHCERTYKPGQFRTEPEDGLQLCPYPGCDGDVVIDAWNWSKVRVKEDGETRYPDHPTPGVQYPLYP